MKQRLPLKQIILMLCLILAGRVYADVPSLPGATQPSVVGKSLTPQQPQATGALPPILSQPSQKKTPLNAQAEKIKFRLNGIVLTGNTIYSTKTLSSIYKDKLHKTQSVAVLFEIVQEITNFYRNNGYILSRAILPPQRVKGGIVHIQIIEGYIGSISVTGNPNGAKCIVQQIGNHIKECKPLQLSVMERYMLIENEIPGTTVKAVLGPSKKEVGAADLTLVTDNHIFTGYVSYDDYGTRYIGPQQMTANLAVNSGLTSGDSTHATVTKTAKGEELTYVDLNYNMALGSQGARWLIGDTYVKTHPLFVLAPVDIRGVSPNYYTSINYPLIRTRSSNLTVRATFNYMDSWVTTLGTKLYTDHLRSVGIGGTYNFADRWYGSNLISADFRQGLPIWGYTQNTNQSTAQTSRPGGSGTYSKIAATLSRIQIIRGPWSLYGSFQGQYSFNPLLSAEQFTFGGSQVGRGYDVAELIGDKGASLSLELRYDWAIGKFLIQMLQPYVFYDGGIIWNYLYVGGTPRKVSATSTGIGLRFYFNNYISGNFMWAQPLTKQVAAEELIGDGWRPRVFFSIVATLD